MNENDAKHLNSPMYSPSLHDVLALSVTIFDVTEGMPEAKIIVWNIQKMTTKSFGI